MKNLFTLLLIALCIGLAILKGTSVPMTPPPSVPAAAPKAASTADVPYIGRIQVLNGCGTGGSAHLVAEFLRKNNFDVKNIGNADNWNYPETLIISRTGDTTIATQVAGVLHTGNMVMIRNNEETNYDATVIVGPDYRERIR
jgi:hypothetical protein